MSGPLGIARAAFARLVVFAFELAGAVWAIFWSERGVRTALAVDVVARGAGVTGRADERVAEEACVAPALVRTRRRRLVAAAAFERSVAVATKLSVRRALVRPEHIGSLDHAAVLRQHDRRQRFIRRRIGRVALPAAAHTDARAHHDHRME